MTGTVDLWRTHLEAWPAFLSQELARHTLTQEEQAQALRLREGAVRQQFQLTRSLLRHLLARALDVPPAKLIMITGPHGKPALQHGDLQFTVAHSGGCILIALSSAGRVGVDVELISETWDPVDIAADCFSSEELCLFLREADADARRSLFFSTWTAKEAVLKADGRGLLLPMRSFSVRSAGEHRVAHLPGAGTFHIHPLSLGTRWAGALACAHSSLPLRRHDFGPEIFSVSDIIDG